MTKPPGELEAELSRLTCDGCRKEQVITADTHKHVITMERGGKFAPCTRKSKEIWEALKRERAAARDRAIDAALAGYRYMESETEYRERLMALKGQTP